MTASWHRRRAPRPRGRALRGVRGTVRGARQVRRNFAGAARLTYTRGVRIAACLGLLAFATFLGALVIGYGVALPGLASSSLIDANLGKALAGPLGLRLAEILVGAGVVLVMTVPGWLGSRAASCIALLLTGAALAHRLLLLPHLGRLWARVDLIAGRPVDTLAEAQRWTQHQEWLLLGMGALLVVLAGLAAARAGGRALAPSRGS